MEVTRTRIRKDFAPLTVAVSLVCKTSGSPMTQVYVAKTNSYEPNRTATPTVLLPQVMVNASDGSIKNPYGNHMLAEMKWLVNGEDITTLTDWQGLYTIRNDGSYRGAIEIRRNVLVSERFQLQFTGTLYDSRLNVTIPIKTDTVTISTNDASEDKYALSMGDDTIIQYDPFKDKLFLYEYKVAHGYQTASTAARQAAMDENAYRREIPFYLFKGSEPCKETYTVKLLRVKTATTFTEIDPTDEETEIVELGTDHVTIDLRMVKKEDYQLRAYIGTSEVARQQFSVNRLYPAYRVRPTNGTAIAPSDIERYDSAMVDCDGNVVECPESITKLIWKTDTAKLKGVEHNEGGTTIFLLEKTGIGNDYTNDWLDTYIETEHKKAHSIAIGDILDGDSKEYTLTDESGNILIFN